MRETISGITRSFDSNSKSRILLQYLANELQSVFLDVSKCIENLFDEITSLSEGSRSNGFGDPSKIRKGKRALASAISSARTDGWKSQSR